jgi:outer membrane protein TolC
MPFPRRIFVLILASLAALSARAQTPETDPGPGAEHLSLDDAIRQALAKNFAIKVEQIGPAIAAARVTESLGKFDPVLSGSYSDEFNRNPLLTTSPLTGLRDTTTDQTDTYGGGLSGLLPWGMTYQLGGSVTNARGTANAYADNFASFAGVSGTQPLLRDFGFGPTLTSIRVAQANHRISEWQFQQTVIDIVTGVIFAYNELNFAYANLRSATRSRDLAAQLVAENEKRFKVGTMSEYDVTSARARVANREEAILIAERAARDAENALKQLVTDEKGPRLLEQRLAIDPLPPAPIVVVDAAADFRLALEKRPDYQQARLVLQRDRLSSRYERNQLLPRVDLVGSYGYNGYDANRAISRRQVQDQDYRSYTWGVVVSVPLTFTTERGRSRAARLQAEQSATELERIEQDIVVRVGNAAGQIETTQKRIRAAREARKLAQATLDAEEKRLRAGQSSTFFVLQQQETLSELEVSELRAQADYQNALAEYDRQLGLTLEKRHIDVLPSK